MCNTQNPLLLNQHKGDATPQDQEFDKLRKDNTAVSKHVEVNIT